MKGFHLLFVATLLLFSEKGQCLLYPMKAQNLNARLLHESGQSSWEKLAFQYGHFGLSTEALSPTILRKNDLIFFQDPLFQINFTVPTEVPLGNFMEIKNLEMSGTESDLKTKVAELNWELDFTQSNIENLDLKISDPRMITFPTSMENYLQALFWDSELSFESFTTKNVQSIIQILNDEIQEKKLNDSKEQKIKDGYLEFSEGNFYLSSKIGSLIKIKLKIEGYAQIDTTLQNISFRIDKAKAGIFNIKGKLFEALASIKDPNIEVVAPYVKIKL